MEALNFKQEAITLTLVCSKQSISILISAQLEAHYYDVEDTFPVWMDKWPMLWTPDIVEKETGFKNKITCHL